MQGVLLRRELCTDTLGIYQQGHIMDQVTASILSLIVAALVTYFGGNAFFDSNLSIAATLKAGLVTMHVRFVFFFVVAFSCYIALSWATAAMTHLSRSKKGR
uniref:Uncharacterized protein n=1 Tax=Pseudomonas fluorescens (strain SBW25) TaxID=216595 RepID=A0A0G4E5C3_PSEFS|nr:hypothetical protein PQBR57_0265 [Pseudomonas fluorescens SBW25]